MRDEKRIDRMMEMLRQIWHKYPDWRLGQVIQNLIFTDGKRSDLTGVRLFHQQDDVTEERLEHYFKEFCSKNGGDTDEKN